MKEGIRLIRPYEREGVESQDLMSPSPFEKQAKKTQKKYIILYFVINTLEPTFNQMNSVKPSNTPKIYKKK